MSWFAVQTRARSEKLVSVLLGSKEYECFLPTYKRERRFGTRIKMLEGALFPGYLFSRFDVTKRLPILTTPGVMRIIGVGQVPVPVSESEIKSLETVVQSGLRVRACPYAKLGQRVRIESGPLCGVEGILTAFKGRDHLIVSVTLLQRSVAVEVDGDSVSLVTERPLAAAPAAGFGSTPYL